MCMSSALLCCLCPAPAQCRGWWRCPRRCGWWRTTPPRCPWWRSTNSAAPRRASSTTTPSPATTTAWPPCRLGARRPVTRYRGCHPGLSPAPCPAWGTCIQGFPWAILSRVFLQHPAVPWAILSGVFPQHPAVPRVILSRVFSLLCPGKFLPALMY